MISVGLDIIAMPDPMKSAYAVHCQITTAWAQCCSGQCIIHFIFFPFCLCPFCPNRKAVEAHCDFFCCHSCSTGIHHSPHYSSLHQKSSDLRCSSCSFFDCSHPQLRYVLMCLHWEVIDELRPLWLHYSCSIPAFSLHLTGSY